MDLKPGEIMDMYQKMATNNVIISFVGSFNQTIINSLLSMFRKNAPTFGIESLYKKKIYNVMVEALENISKHSSLTENLKGTKDYPGIFLLERTGETFYVSTGNLILNKNISSLEEKLQDANTMSKEQLKDKYRDILVNGKVSEKGGAGIGVFDMVMKSGNSLGYEFRKIDDLVSFYILKITIITDKEQ
jgi:hypothetical protein